MTQKTDIPNNIIILGVGNILYRDDGVGIRVVQKLEEEYDFPDDGVPRRQTLLQ